MPSSKIFAAALFCLFGPPLFFLAWHQGQEYQRVQALQPWHLPGKVVMLHSFSCGACVRMMPIVEDAQKRGYPIELVDVRSASGDGSKYRARSVPTFIYELDGKERFRSVGLMSAETLANFCRGIRSSRL